MIVIGTIVFPESSANQVAECYKTLPPTPDFITVDGTYAYNKPGEQFRAFSIFNFDESRLDEANAYFEKRYAAFGKVDKLTSTYEEWLSAEEALSIVEAGTYDLDLKIF
jgi:hypothetical protein